MVVWSLAMLHPQRGNKVICLSLPYPVRGEVPWLEFMEAVLGSDYYFVHVDRQPGVADAVFDENPARFLRNLYRKNEPPEEPRPGMAMIDLARAGTTFGEPLMSDSDLAVYVSTFEKTGFTGGINRYRNLDRDAVSRAENLPGFVPDVEDPPRQRSLDPAGAARRDQPGDHAMAGATRHHPGAMPGVVAGSAPERHQGSRSLK